MKITKSKLKQIIKEELENAVEEGLLDFLPWRNKEKSPPEAPALDSLGRATSDELPMGVNKYKQISDLQRRVGELSQKLKSRGWKFTRGRPYVEGWGDWGQGPEYVYIAGSSALVTGRFRKTKSGRALDWLPLWKQAIQLEDQIKKLKKTSRQH